MATFTKYQKKNGEIAWQFSAYLGVNPETGKSIKTTRRGFKNKKAAQLELAKLQAEFDAVEWTEKTIDLSTNDYT
ncbi:Arm DNA-binding domain-containing protein, partial [Enterococcus cecorum]